MARYTPVLQKNKPQPGGHFPIWLRFSDRDRTLYASIGVSIHPRFWNEAKKEVRKGHVQSEGINALIQARLNEVEAERLRLLREGEPVTAEALKAVVAVMGDSAATCFIVYVREFIAEIEAKGNIRRFKREASVMNKFQEFSGSPLPFDKITSITLRKYENHLLTKGNKPSTIKRDMKVIRSHYRRAMKEGIVTRDADPFFAYTLPTAERPERYKLTEAELARIESLDPGGTGPTAPLISRVRDAFLFSLYEAGIRFADVARLTVGNITEEANGDGTRLRLSYRMGKTGKRATLPLIPQAERIARAYMVDEAGKPKSRDSLLFSMLEGYDLDTPRKVENAIGSQNAVHNKALKRIAELAKVSGTLTFHASRHSFADLARKRGWDVYALKAALAHSSLSVTEGYLAGFDSELIDERMSTLFENGHG